MQCDRQTLSALTPDNWAAGGRAIHSFHCENIAGCLDITYNL